MIVYDIQDLVKTYPGQPQPANNHITLQIQQGEIFGILGDNGAGKSTLVRQMVNLVSSSSGQIQLFGQDITKDPFFVSQHVGYMPQDNVALNNLTVGEALFFAAHLRGLSRADARQQREHLIDLWQLESVRNKTTQRLSGGQKQLAQLATAMAGAPPVLILDEPTNNLDPQRRKMVWDVLRQSNQAHGITIIFITHDAIEAEKIIQRVGIMHQGELVAMGRPRELKQEIDRKLRLELFFNPQLPPELPPELPCYKLDPDRWLVLVDLDQVQYVLNLLDLSTIEDFRLYSATLEDLYLHYANSVQTPVLAGASR